MFRALSTRRRGRGYERLGDESSSSSVGLVAAAAVKLKRAASVPAKVQFCSCRKLAPESNPAAKQAKKVSKIHPFFRLFDKRSGKRSATAKPEFARYVEYVKEGGVWDVSSNKPVIYYK